MAMSRKAIKHTSKKEYSSRKPGYAASLFSSSPTAFDSPPPNNE
jgi:hypothetical protein